MRYAERHFSYKCYSQALSDKYGWNVDCCYLDGKLISDVNLWHLTGFARRYLLFYFWYEVINYVDQITSSRKFSVDGPSERYAGTMVRTSLCLD